MAAHCSSSNPRPVASADPSSGPRSLHRRRPLYTLARSSPTPVALEGSRADPGYSPGIGWQAHLEKLHQRVHVDMSAATVTEAIGADLACQQISLVELHIDRAYLSSTWVRERSADLQVYCKAWPMRNGPCFPKTAFHLDWEQQILRCPHKQEMPFVPGGWCTFPPSSVPPAPCKNAVPPVSTAALWAFILMSTCCGNCANRD